MQVRSKYFFLIYLFLFSLISKAQEAKINTILSKLKGSIHDTTRLLLLYDLAVEYSSNDRAQSLKTIEEGSELAKKLNKPVMIAAFMQIKGKAYLNYDNATAIECFSISAAENEKMHNLNGKASALTGIGVAYLYSGDYKKAIFYNIESLKTAEAINNKHAISQAYNNLLAIYISMEDYKTALSYGFKSLHLKLEINDDANLDAAYGNIGTCYSNLGQYDSSTYFNNKSLAIRKKTGDKQGIALCYNNLATDYSELKDYKKALTYLEMSRSIYEELNDESGLSLCLTNMGDLYSLMKEFKKALPYSLRSLDLARKTGAMDDIKNSLHSVSLIYEGLGDHKSALKYFKDFTKVKDTLVNTESAKQISEIQTKFDTEKKEEQIKIQKLEINSKESDIKRQKGFLLIVSVGFIIVLVLSFFIFKSYRDKKKANEALQSAYHIIEEKNLIVETKQKEILDSIKYARRIQQSLLPTDKYMERNLKN